jgi:aminoglycoside phosphotransferase (APT) family kinase protein
MKTKARDIDREQLIRTITDEYGLDVTQIAFTPRGEDAYNYIADTADGRRYFVRVQDAERAGSLEQVYTTTRALHERYHLLAVVAPHATRRGRLTVNFGLYTLAVFSYIEGRTLWDQGAADADLAQAAAIMAALHESGAAREIPSLGRESFENPFKTPILRALQTATDRAPAANRYQRELIDLLNAERQDILATLHMMDALGARAGELAVEWVLTHGDPNLDNLLKDKHGRLHVTDWGEVALGPPERDLMLFTGERFEVFLRAYVSARTRVALHQELFAFYFHRWGMQEIADYATRILFGGLGPEEDEHAWVELGPYLPIRHDLIARGLQRLQAVLDCVMS